MSCLVRRQCAFLLILGVAVIGPPLRAQQSPPIPPKTVDTPVPPPLSVPTPPVLPTDVPNRPLTADEAARIALQRQPDVTVARAGVTAAQGRTQQVRSGLLPTLTLSAGVNNFTTISGTGAGGGTGTVDTTTGTGTVVSSGSGAGTNSTTLTGVATLRQLIFDFNHTRDLVRQSAALERVAAQNLTRVQYDLVLQVKQAFYTYQQNVRLVGVNEANVQNRQNQLAEAQARLNSGLGLPSDVATAQTAVAEAVSELILARSNANLARVSLALQMGIDPRTPVVPTDAGEPPFPSNDVNGLVNQGLRNRPEVLQAQANVQSNQYGVRAARTTNAPVISGSLSVSSRGSNIPPEDSSFIIGAAISFTPFDGGLTAGRVKEAQANLGAAQAQLTSAQLTVVSDVTQAYITLRHAEQRVAATQNDVANASEGVRIAEGRYRAGLGLFLDIINAQAQLLTARTNQATAQAAVEQARAALQRAIGSPVAPGR